MRTVLRGTITTADTEQSVTLPASLNGISVSVEGSPEPLFCSFVSGEVANKEGFRVTARNPRHFGYVDMTSQTLYLASSVPALRYRVDLSL